jgi:hypothetical protein
MWIGILATHIGHKLTSNWHTFNDIGLVNMGIILYVQIWITKICSAGHMQDRSEPTYSICMFTITFLSHMSMLVQVQIGSHTLALLLQLILPSKVNVLGRCPWYSPWGYGPCTLVSAGQIQSGSMQYTHVHTLLNEGRASKGPAGHQHWSGTIRYGLHQESKCFP